MTKHSIQGARRHAGSDTLVPFDDLTTVAIFSCLVSITIAAVYYVTRLGFEDTHAIPILKCLSVSCFLVLLAPVWRYVQKLLGFQVYLPDAGLCLVGLTAVACGGLAVRYTSVNAAHLFYALGGVFFLLVSFLWLREGSWRANLLFAFVITAFSLWLAASTLGSGYQDPLFSERLLIGETKLDMIFHCAVANMLRTYGVPSTGLDGIPWIPYHFGSHWLFAQVSRLLGMDIVMFYNLGFPVIFIPFMLCSILIFAVFVRTSIAEIRENSSPLRSDTAFWGIVFLVHVGIVPLKFYTWNTQLYSQSYALGLALIFIFFSLTFFLVRVRQEEEKVGRNWASIILFLCLPVMLGVLGIFKNSLMFLFLTLWCFLVFRLGLYRQKSVLLLGLLMLTVLFWVTGLTVSAQNNPDANLVISPFHFLFNFVAKEWWPFFYISELFWSWLFVFMRLYQQDILTWGKIKTAVISRQILDVESVTMLCLVGFAPGLFMDLNAGAAWYFSDLQRWLSMTLILANLDGFKARVGISINENITAKVQVLNPRFLKIIAGAILVLILCNASYNSLLQFRNFISKELDTRRQLLYSVGVSGREEWSRIVIAVKERKIGDIVKILGGAKRLFCNENLRHIDRYDKIQALNELSRISDEDKRRSLVFVSKSTLWYWRLLGECKQVPFLVPSITGIASLEGLPDNNCDSSMYGYSVYKNLKCSELPHDLPDWLCSRAKSNGFSKIIVLDSNHEGGPVIRYLSCGAD